MSPLVLAATTWSGPGPFWPAFLLVPLFWFGVIALVVWLAARSRRRFWAAQGFGPGWQDTRSGESVLGERFARGEIDEVEYRSRLEVLGANRPTASARR